MPGFPIRTSADRGLVDGSPQLFAVTHVLHRFLAPRHPPLALCSLENTFDRSFELYSSHPSTEVDGCDKMLVLALQFSRSHRTAVPAVTSGSPVSDQLDAGVRGNNSLKTEEKTVATDAPVRKRDRIPAISDRCDDSPPVHQQVCLAPGSNECRSSSGEALLRKEVIQPHLPVRLPCYDLAPVTGFTLNSSLLAVRTLALGTPGFHGLTGGVYKARERIHRGMLIRDY